jgi:hypothetical protein
MNFDLRTLRKECINCIAHTRDMFKDGADDTKETIKIGNRTWYIKVSDYGDMYGFKVYASDKDKQIYELRYSAGKLDGSVLFKNIIDTETEED